MDTAKFQLSRSFILLEQDGTAYTAENIIQAAKSAIASLNGCRRLTIDARHAYATMIGLIMSSYHGLDIALARDIDSHKTQQSDQVELLPGLIAWPDHHTPPVAHGIRINTSGTTGKAKTACYSLDRMAAAVRLRTSATNAVWLLTYEPASFAGIQVILTAAINGAKLLCPKRSIGMLADALRCDGVTHVSGTPSFWRALMSTLPANQTIRLEVATLGGEACSQEVLNEISQRFPDSAIRHIYASTEAGVGFTVSDGLAGFPASWLNEGVDNVQLRISHDELQIHTKRGMVKYEGADTAAMKDWLNTGDLVEVRGDRVFFVGRRDSTVNIGGIKVLPEKIEALLATVSDVVDIAITVHPNPILGHILTAQVCAAPDADRSTVEASLKTKAMAELPPVARPARYRFVDSVILPSGKKERKYVSD